MDAQVSNPNLVATIDVRELQSIRWGPLRLMFPTFVEEIELARYLKSLLSTRQCEAVRIEAHREDGGRPSTHVFDVYAISRAQSSGTVHRR